MTTLVIVASATNDDARFAELGITANAIGGTMRAVRDGIAFVVAVWIGGESFVVTSRSRDGWLAVETTRENLAYEVSTAIESAVFA